MIRHLMTLVLSAILGSIVLVGNADACHNRKCGCTAPVTCRVSATACIKPVKNCKPAPCVKPVVANRCALRVRTCRLTLPKLCFKQCPRSLLACASPVYCAVLPGPKPGPSPQASAQH
jgi:hypothetical protein